MEFIFYNKVCYFYRLSVYHNLETIVKILIKEFDIDKKLDDDSFNNCLNSLLPIKENGTKLLNCLIQYQKFINESETFSLFDTLENFISYS